MTHVFLAAFQCKEGSPAKTVGTDRILVGPGGQKEQREKRERGRKRERARESRDGEAKGRNGHDILFYIVLQIP